MVVKRLTQLALMANDLRRGNISSAISRVKGKPVSRSHVKRFQRSYGVNPAKAAGNAWLELQYGWLPLIGDVYQAAQLLAYVSQREKNLVCTIRVSARREAEEVNVQPASPYPGANVVFDEIRKWTEQKRLVFHYRLQDEGLQVASLLGLTNPLEIVWELVPFSFVADWFIPIGDFISNASALHGITPLDYSLGRKVDLTFKAENFRFSGEIGGLDVYGAGESRLVKIQRDVYQGAPPNQFDSKVSFDMSARRITSGIALLSQQLSRLRK
jgi:hypothetical protein